MKHFLSKKIFKFDFEKKIKYNIAICLDKEFEFGKIRPNIT